MARQPHKHRSTWFSELRDPGRLPEPFLCVAPLHPSQGTEFNAQSLLDKGTRTICNRCRTLKAFENDYPESALKRPKPKKNKSPRSLVKSKMYFSIPFVSQDSTDTFVVFATKPQKCPLNLVESSPIRSSTISLGGLLHCVPFMSDKFNHGVQRSLDKHKIARLCNPRGRTILKTTARSPSWPAMRVISLGIRTIPVLSVAKKLAAPRRAPTGPAAKCGPIRQDEAD